MERLVICKIPQDFNITLHFKEIEKDNIKHVKDIIRIINRLKDNGFYSGEELEYSMTLLYKILKDVKFIIQEFDKVGYGIDILNLNIFN